MNTRLSKILDPRTPEGKEVYFITYGTGSHLANCYSTIYAKDIEEARKIAFRTTGGQHAFLYEPLYWVEGGQTQAERYNLALVPLQPQYPISARNPKYNP